MARVASVVTAGIDIGTTSVKALAVDGDGNVVARTRVAHKVDVGDGTALAHDANRAWRRGPVRALAQLGASDLRGVSVVGMVPSLTAVDRRGRPRTPGLLYGDARGRREGAVAEPEGFARWLAAECPDARGLWPAQAVANFALGGANVVDTSVGATCSPLFSLDTWTWDASLLGDLGVRVSDMPRVAGMGEAIGRVGDAALDAGGVDAVGEQLVAGADQVGDVLVLLGTTLIVWVVTDGYPEVPGLQTFPHLGAAGLAFVGGPSNAGGLFLDWVGSWLGRGGGVAAPHGVPVWVPYPRGERSPIDDPTRRAALHDLDLTHGTAAVRRAAFEASGFVARRIIELSGLPARRIVASGGGARVGAWVQALADCTSLPCDVVGVPEGGALGAAFLARMAAGLETSLGDARRWASVSHRVEPDPAWSAPAGERYARFLDVAG